MQFPLCKNRQKVFSNFSLLTLSNYFKIPHRVVFFVKVFCILADLWILISNATEYVQTLFGLTWLVLGVAERQWSEGIFNWKPGGIIYHSEIIFI